MLCNVTATKPTTIAPTTPVSIAAPSGEKIPNKALIVAFITKKPTTPAKAAVPLSRFASPIHRPTHNNIARFAKTTVPAALIIVKTPCNTGLFNTG